MLTTPHRKVPDNDTKQAKAPAEADAFGIALF